MQIKTSAPLDHGVLNIPLSKRGDIDAQIDAYKRNEAAEARQVAKASAAEKRELRKQAGALLDAMPAEQLARIAAKSKLTEKQAMRDLRSLAYFTPKAVLKLNGAAA